MANEDQEEICLWTKNTARQVAGLSNTKFYAEIREGNIPQGVLIGPRIRRYPSNEIRAYVRRRMAERDAKGAQ